MARVSWSMLRHGTSLIDFFETPSPVLEVLIYAVGSCYAGARASSSLMRYADDGSIEIDNNAAERAIRALVLGRRNYLFAGSDAGGETAARLYSLIRCGPSAPKILRQKADLRFRGDHALGGVAVPSDQRRRLLSALLHGGTQARLHSLYMTSMITTMPPPRRSPIALAVLVMLYEAPMHPYRMQRLIKERGKDEVINVTQRGSLYQTIQRLEREGLISAQRTIRDDRWPERTVYKITRKGRAVALDWMREILSTPAREYPDFPAAISFLALLSPEDALHQLELRANAIRAELDRIDQGLKEAAQVPRLFLLEVEYLRAMQATELTWVNSVVKDLRAAHLTWDEAWLRQVTAEFSPDSDSGSE